jgi:hypothetical protein
LRDSPHESSLLYLLVDVREGKSRPQTPVHPGADYTLRAYLGKAQINYSAAIQEG